MIGMIVVNYEYILILFVIFLGGFARTYFGFGEALVSMPLLALIGLDLHTAISVIGLAGVLVAAFKIFLDFKSIQYQLLIILLVGSAIGVPIGIWILNFANVEYIQIMLGYFLVLYGVYAFSKNVFYKNTQPFILHNKIWGAIAGMISGVLGSLYNSHGVPIVIYATLTRWSVKTLSSTIQAHFLITAIFVVMGQGIGGIWTNQTWFIFSMAVPILICSVIAGKILIKVTSNRSFDTWLYLFIIALGIVLAMPK